MSSSGSGFFGKTAPPRLPAVLPRRRLFRLLDRSRAGPLVWVVGPPGAGKTTLLASYLEARRLRTLWCQVDEGDDDVATFFHYMTLAARRAVPRSRRRLPMLKPEFRAGLPTFARRYFEALSGRLRPPFVIVLDNYQEVPADSALHDIVCRGVEALPRGAAVVVVSRSAPPPAFARLRASGAMRLIAGEALRLTAPEAVGIARLRGRNRSSGSLIGRIHDRTQGWAAGLALLLERTTVEDGVPDSATPAVPQSIFDYFAGEVFGKTDEATRRILLCAAFLPETTASMAERLAGMRGAERILADLHRRNFFTERRSQQEPLYQFHPLFREFLQARARESFTASRLAQVRRQAGELLAQAGKPEQAVALLRDAGDWGGMAELVLAQAPALLAQGRHQTLEEWVGYLPAAMTEPNAWLQYWLGTSRAPFAPAIARRHFERAFGAFRRTHDAAGTFAAWSGVIETIVAEWSDFKALDEWIGMLDELRREHPRWPSVDIETRVSSAMVRALMHRQPQHPEIEAWMARARALAQDAGTDARMLIGSALTNYYLWIGQQARAAAALEGLRDLAQARDAAPLVIATYRSVEGTYHWHTASAALCRLAADIGLETARKSGVHIVDPQLRALHVYGALLAGDLTAAQAGLRDMGKAVDGNHGLHAAHHHFLSAWHAFLRGDLAMALEHATEATAHADATGAPYPQVWNHLGMAAILEARGEYQRAQEQLTAARRSALGLRSLMLDYMFGLAEAHLGFAQGKDDTALSALRGAMALGRRQGFLMARWWHPAAMARLCARALEAGIEVPYAQALARQHRLLPEARFLTLESWPWPVQVYTLGEFRFASEGQPVRFAGKVQQRPVDVLKALVAHGPRGMAEAALADALWPDSESDAAHQALATTLHRLRALIGPECVILRAGMLRLAPQRCWVDAWTFEQLLDEAEASESNGAGEAARATVERALALYRGPFLGTDTGERWLAAARERYRRRFLRHVAALGREFEAAGERRRAFDWYERGLAADDLAEELYRRLMACHLRAGQRAEGLSVYRRCHAALAAGLGVPPSPDTEAVHRALRAG